MADDPLQQDLNQQPGLPVPHPEAAIDWSKARPAFPKAAAPAPAAQAAPAASGPDIDWSKARPAFPNQAVPAAEPQGDQGVIGNAIDFADKYLTSKSADDNSPIQALAQIGQPALGFAKGAMDTLHFAGAASSHALKALGIDVPDISFNEPQYLEAHGTGQTVGKVSEGVLEFFMGDEALKGASMAEKLKQATKLAEFMESSPRLAAALTTGIGALRMGAVSAAGTLAHGGSGEGALKSGLVTGGIGGGLQGLGAISKLTSIPLLSKVASGAEIAGGTAIAGSGAMNALTPQQADETPQQALTRRVNGVVQGILGTYGAASAAGEAGNNLQAARARQTAGWLNDVEKDVFWASPTSQGKTAGSTPEAKTYRETIRAAMPQLLEVVRDNPTASTPKDMSRAIQSRIDGVEGRLRRVAETTNGYDTAVLDGVEDDFRQAADAEFKKTQGAFKKPVWDKAVDEMVERLRQGEGDEPRDPNLFEAENLRQKLNEETGEAPDRSSAANTLKQVAVRTLRDSIDQGYEDLGVPNVKEWRQQEAPLITVKDQIQLGEKALEKANKTPLLNKLIRSAGWAGLGTFFGGPFGSAVGMGGIGFELGPIVREYMESRENNPEIRLGRVIKRAGQLDKVGYQPPNPAVVPGTSGFTPPITLPKAVPASVPNDAAAGVLRDTGSLRRGPLPEAPPEIAKEMTGTGLEYIGSDSMGLSHFHDPISNNTLSIPTGKVTQDVLMTKLAEKAELAKNSKPPLPYQTSNPQVKTAEKNFVQSLIEYNKAKKDMDLTPKTGDRLQAQQKVREAQQRVIQAQDEHAKIATAFRESQLESRIESDKQYAETFKPMIEGDIPHEPILWSTASPVRETMTHEYGHASLEALFPALAKAGVKISEIQTATHPGLTDAPGTLAAAHIDYGDITQPKHIQEHLGDLMQMAAMGGAAEEVLHGTKIKENQGLSGDIQYMKHYMDALEVPEMTQKMMIDRAFELAKEKLKTPGVIDIIEKYSNGREAGLDDSTLHASRTRIASMNDEIKNLLENPDAGNSTRPTRPSGEGNTKTAEEPQGNAAGGVPQTNAERAGAANQTTGLREQTDQAIERAVRAISLRQQIAALGDKFPLEKARLQIQLDHVVGENQRAEENTGQTGSNRGMMKALGIATGAGALAGTALRAQDKNQMPDGMAKVGNIDVNHRPVIHNDDGSVSTIFSATVPLDKNGNLWKGKYEEAPQYALVPTIAGGKFFTEDGKLPKELLNDSTATEAQKNIARGLLEDAAGEYYQKTKQHLGIFKTSKAADDFANLTHAWTPTGGKEKVFLPPARKEK